MMSIVVCLFNNSCATV